MPVERREHAMKIRDIELTIEINNLKQMVGMMQTAITAKCIDCSYPVGKYLRREEFCKTCPLFRYREKEVKSG